LGTKQQSGRSAWIEGRQATKAVAAKQTRKSTAVEMVSNMSKAQKRGNREAKKPKAIKKVEQPTVSSSQIKTVASSSDQPKKKR
jgi:hypothetical protein